MVRHALSRADLITTDGPALKDELLDTFPFCSGKVESILWGVEIDEFIGLRDTRQEARRTLRLPSDAVVITLARGLRLHDRAHVSLPALLETLNANPRAYGLVLTLGHPPRPEIKEVLAQLRSHERCRIVDRFLERPDVNDVWAASDFVVSIPRFDGISESLLEAMAAGCIPVLSDIAPNRIIVPDPENAIFSNADTASVLASDMQAALDMGEDSRQAATAANCEWVRKNASIDRAADRLAELLTDVSNKSHV
jgi:glycosyltransferase involved in cell wall biosynthesis